MRGFDALVTVDHRVNEAPRRWGYHLLGSPYDPAFRRPRRYFEALEEYLERRGSVHGCAPWASAKTLSFPDWSKR